MQVVLGKINITLPPPQLARSHTILHSMPKIVNPPTFARRNANNLQVALKTANNVGGRRPPQRRARPRRQSTVVVRRGGARAQSRSNPLLGVARRLLLKAIDRLANPRVHMGEPQPRRTPIPGVMVSSAKSLSNFTPSTQFHAVVMGNTYGTIGFTMGTSTGSTVAFTATDTVENTSFSASQVGTLNLSAGSMSVLCGTGLNDASGFVTVGCIPAQFGSAANLATLDPGDLINAPGAETMPMWDFLNKSRTGIFRKLSPAADTFYEPTAAAATDQSMVPFVLFNVPTGVLANTVFSVQVFKSYDFYPEIIDQVVPGVESQASEAECQAAGYAQQILGADITGSYPYVASSVANGAAATLIYKLQQTAIDGFVAYLANYIRGPGGRGMQLPTGLDLV